MLACVDVDYRADDTAASVACLLFERWSDSEPAEVVQTMVTDVAPYVPGEFYRRELPCLLAVLAQAPLRPDLIIVDGYVWLGAPKRPAAPHMQAELTSRGATGPTASPLRGTRRIAAPALQDTGDPPCWGPRPAELTRLGPATPKSPFAEMPRPLRPALPTAPSRGPSSAPYAG